MNSTRTSDEDEFSYRKRHLYALKSLFAVVVELSPRKRWYASISLLSDGFLSPFALALPSQWNFSGGRDELKTGFKRLRDQKTRRDIKFERKEKEGGKWSPAVKVERGGGHRGYYDFNQKLFLDDLRCD